MTKPDFDAIARACLGRIEACRPEFINFDRPEEVVAQAFRDAYDAALDLAGHIAHNRGKYSMDYVDDEPPMEVVIHNNACWEIRDAIRAAKGEQK